MTASSSRLLYVVLAVQVAVLLGLAVREELGLRSGVRILLETRPVDPRDLVRGDYVALAYDISTVPLNQFSPPLGEAPPPGTVVWLLLEPRGQFYELSHASLPRPGSAEGQVTVRGTVREQWWGRNESVRLEFGLERYYVREGTGNPTGKVTVEASVDRSGHARIRQVFVDGRPYTDAMRDEGK